MKKIYLAGKVSPTSSFSTPDWRDGVCAELAKITGEEIRNLDPLKSAADFAVNQNNADLVVGRNAYMLQQADVVVVYLSDDISVGGSQEMLIAKYFGKLLLGIAPVGGKFRKAEKEMLGKVYKNYIDPYVLTSCDALAHDVAEAGEVLRKWWNGAAPQPKDMKEIERTVQYYRENFLEKDRYLSG